MHHLNGNKTGLAVGCFAGVLHLGWSVLVAVGWAQGLVNMAYQMHFILPAPLVAHFSWGTAATLVITTTLCGYAAGWVFATIWNRIHAA